MCCNQHLPPQPAGREAFQEQSPKSRDEQHQGTSALSPVVQPWAARFPWFMALSRVDEANHLRDHSGREGHLGPRRNPWPELSPACRGRLRVLGPDLCVCRQPFSFLQELPCSLHPCVFSAPELHGLLGWSSCPPLSSLGRQLERAGSGC